MRLFSGTKVMNIIILIVGLNPDATSGRVRGRPFAREPIELDIAAVFAVSTGAVLEDIVSGPSTLRILVKVT